MPLCAVFSSTQQSCPDLSCPDLFSIISIPKVHAGGASSRRTRESSQATCGSRRSTARKGLTGHGNKVRGEMRFNAVGLSWIGLDRTG